LPSSAYDSLPPWRPLPELLTLGSNEVHVWRARLDQAPSQVQSLQQTLAADERARAERFYFQRDREHFIVARGLLRVILGRCMGMEPDRLAFCYNSYGKPALGRDSGGDTLRFNVSHSHELALYAVTREHEIDVDLERLRSDLADEQIAERFFSRREFAVLRAVPTNMRQEAFFKCWTRKEAYVKAKGKGLSLPLDQFDVSLAPGEPAALLNTKLDPEEASHWSLQELTPGPGYVAAGNG